MILTYDLVSRIIVSGAFLAYLILFDAGIPNLVCGFLLGCWSGPYHFGSLWSISSILQLNFLKCVLS